MPLSSSYPHQKIIEQLNSTVQKSARPLQSQRNNPNENRMETAKVSIVTSTLSSHAVVPVTSDVAIGSPRYSSRPAQDDDEMVRIDDQDNAIRFVSSR